VALLGAQRKRSRPGSRRPARLAAAALLAATPVMLAAARHTGLLVPLLLLATAAPTGPFPPRSAPTGRPS
jgi:hypothetical protein